MRQELRARRWNGRLRRGLPTMRRKLPEDGGLRLDHRERGIDRQVRACSTAPFVLRHARGNPAAVAQLAEQVASALPGATVRDIGTAQHLIGSSLTAVDLVGLSRTELVFAVIMVAGAAGLVLALGLADRRRGFAVLSALGAKPSQLTAFLWSEGLLIFAVGGAVGLAGASGWNAGRAPDGCIRSGPGSTLDSVGLCRCPRLCCFRLCCRRRDRGAMRDAGPGDPAAQGAAISRSLGCRAQARP